MTFIATTTKKSAKVGVLVVASAIALSGCSGSGAPASNSSDTTGENQVTQAVADSIYQFDQARFDDSIDQIPFVSSSGAVTVRLSDELQNVIPGGRVVPIDQYVLTAKAFSTGICRIDVEISYVEGGKDMLAGRVSDWAPEKVLLSALTGKTTDLEVVNEIPSDDMLTKETKYLTRDFSHVTLVDACSEDAGEKLVSLYFPYEPYVPNKPTLGDFADIDVAVLAGTQSGSSGASMSITGSTDAELSVTGGWAPPES